MVKKIVLVMRYTIYIIFSLLFGVTLFFGNAKAISGNSMPMPFGYGIGVVVSGSMEPKISVDDLIIVKERKVYHVGDIVVYQSRGVLVVHEIVEINGDYVITKGTANNIEDDPVPISQLKGEVVEVYEDVGKYFRFIKSPSGMIIMISATLLLLILSFQSEKKEDKNEINKLEEELEKLKNSNK